jgi:sulfur carrier protein
MERVVGEQALSVLVNGESRSVPTGTTVETLLGVLGMGHRRLAVAVNRSVVPRSTYGRVALAAGDRIEILEAVGGG